MFLARLMLGARGGVGFELFGNGGKAEFGGRMSARGTASSGSQDNTTESGRQSNADNHDTSSQAVKDFRESSDYFINQKSSSLETSLITMHLLRLINFLRKRAARTVLTGMCYSVGSATRQG
jgi:hypothetical protein